MYIKVTFIAWACRYEFTINAEDVLVRRTRTLFLDTAKTLCWLLYSISLSEEFAALDKKYILPGLNNGRINIKENPDTEKRNVNNITVEVATILAH